MPLSKLGIVKPDLTSASEAQRQYIELLESAVSNRQVGDGAQGIHRPSWPIDRLLSVGSIVGMALLWIFGAGGQYRDFQTLADRVKLVEQRSEVEQAKNDALYARRDLYDLRMKNMDDKLDAIGLDVKALKSSGR